MALNGSISFSRTISGRNSIVTVTGTVTATGVSWIGSSGTGSYSITQNGVTLASGSINQGVSQNSTATLFSTNVTVSHDDNGDTSTIYASFSYAPNIDGGIYVNNSYTPPNIGANVFWTDINALNPGGVQDSASAIFDVTYSAGSTYYNCVNEPSSLYYKTGTTIKVFNIRPYYDYYVISSITSPNGSGSISGGWTHTQRGNNTDIITIQTAYKQYTVTFDANGGSSPVSSLTVTYNSAYGTFPTPTWTGYTFLGWYDAREGGNRILGTNTYTIVGNQTLYAHWEVTPYTVTLNPNNGIFADGSSDTIIFPIALYYKEMYGRYLDNNTYIPTRDEYIFSGYYDAATGAQIYGADGWAVVDDENWGYREDDGEIIYLGARDLSLYAKWYSANSSFFITPQGSVFTNEFVESDIENVTLNQYYIATASQFIEETGITYINQYGHFYANTFNENEDNGV